MTFAQYRLPDGRVVDVDASAAKGERTIGFELARGVIVTAVQVRETCPRCDGDGFGAMGASCDACYGSGKVPAVGEWRSA